MTEQQLLDAARDGDEDAFARLIAPHRRELYAHCYRMLGLLGRRRGRAAGRSPRAWRGLPRFEGRSSLRSWLYTIATNACLQAIERRPRRVLPIDYGPPARPARPDRPAAGRVGLDRAVSPTRGSPASSIARRPLRAAREPSSSRSSPRSSTCPPASARCCSSATCSASRPARPPRRSRRRPSRSTARCSAPTRPSTRDCPSAASRRRCARSMTATCGASSRASCRLGARRRRRDRGHARRGRRARDAAGADVVRRARRHRRLPRRDSARLDDAATPARAHLGQRPDRVRPLQLARGAQRRSCRHAITVLSLRDTELSQLTFFRSADAFTGFDLPDRITP